MAGNIKKRSEIYKDMNMVYKTSHKLSKYYDISKNK